MFLLEEGGAQLRLHELWGRRAPRAARLAVAYQPPGAIGALAHHAAAIGAGVTGPDAEAACARMRDAGYHGIPSKPRLPPWGAIAGAEALGTGLPSARAQAGLSQRTSVRFFAPSARCSRSSRVQCG